MEGLALILYAIKLRSFKSYDAQNGKIKSILWRIITLTLFNDIFALCSGFIVSYLAANKFDQTENDILLSIGLCIYAFGYLSPSIVISNSMRLMMKHNTNDYVKFLRILLILRYICCCIKGNLTKQLLYYDDDNRNDINSNKQSTVELETERNPTPKSSKKSTTAVTDRNSSTVMYPQKGSQTQMK